MLALLLALQQTLTVDDDGPADFTEIQAAVDAAAPGSLILVRPGVYDRVTLPAHSISIVADGEPRLLDPPRPYID